MNLSMRLSSLAFLLLALTLGSTSRGTSVRFAPAEGTTLQKQFTQDLEMELSKVEVSVNDEQQEVPDIELSIHSVDSYTLLDGYQKMGDGRPELLTRHFENIERMVLRSISAGGEEGEGQEVKGASELQGKHVLFRWNDESEAFDAEWGEEDSGDDELLSELQEDFDLRGFLPPGEVEEGDTWSVDIRDFEHFWNPSGNLRILDEGEEPENESEASLRRQLDENLSGEVEARFGGLREVEGLKLAVITITVKASTNGAAAVETEDQGFPPGAEMVRSRELVSELEGELLWDLEAAHLHSAQLKGSVDYEQSETTSFSIEENDIEVVRSMHFSGAATYSTSFTAAE